MSSQPDSKSTIALSKGYWFMFQHKGVAIAAYGSGITGKEVVYVNDDPVSSRRSMSFVSRHQFDYEGDSYQITYEMENLFTGKVSCTLDVEGEEPVRQEKAMFTSVKGTFAIYICLAFIGAILGSLLMMFLIELLA